VAAIISRRRNSRKAASSPRNATRATCGRWGLSDEGNVMKLPRRDTGRATWRGAIKRQRDAAAHRRRAAGHAGRREARGVAESFISSAPFSCPASSRTKAAMKAYYDSHLADYRQPERVRAEYAVLSAAELAQGESASGG